MTTNITTGPQGPGGPSGAAGKDGVAGSVDDTTTTVTSVGAISFTSGATVTDGGAGIAQIAIAGGGGSPADPDTSLQFNDGGSFAGSSFNFVSDQITATVSHASALGVAIAAVGSGGTDGSAVLTVVGGTLAMGGVASTFNATITDGALASIDSVADAGGPYTVVPSDPVHVTSDDAGPLTGATINFGSVGWKYSPSIVGSDAALGLAFAADGSPILYGNNTTTIQMAGSAGAWSQSGGMEISRTGQVLLVLTPTLGTSGDIVEEWDAFNGNGGSISQLFLSAGGKRGAATPIHAGNIYTANFMGLTSGPDNYNISATDAVDAVEDFDDTHFAVSRTISTIDTVSENLLPRLVIDGSGNTNILNGVLAVSTAVAIADLPASPTTGMFAAINDAMTPTVGLAVASGGAASAVVCYGGTQWTVISI